MSECYFQLQPRIQPSMYLWPGDLVSGENIRPATYMYVGRPKTVTVFGPKSDS